MKYLNNSIQITVRPLFKQFVISLFFLSSVGCSLTSEQRPLEVITVPSIPDKTTVQKSPVTTGPLKVLSLNMAHGRKDSTNQIFLSKQTIYNNLSDIASLLKQTSPSLVALQEADGPSHWSGNFDHVAQLAEQAQYPWYTRAAHAQGWLYNYGTALLSRSAFTEVVGHAFQPTPPTMTKGFLLGQIKWQPDKEKEAIILIDIISVHLDFSRRSVRQQQIQEMIQVLSARNNPVIILGDFNSDWFSEEAIIKDFVNQSRFQAYQSGTKNLGTYSSNKRRLDWILISEELEFKSYKVLPDIVSDHSAIVAEIGFRIQDEYVKATYKKYNH